MKLFAERARLAAPDFDLAEQRETVTAICERLEGMPLAVELAAARVAALAPDELLTRLDRSLALLTRGPRDLAERHRSLRAALEWTHELLEPEERTLFAADRWRQPVVQRGFDEQPAGVGGAGLGDLAQPARLARAVLGRDQPDVAGDRVGVLEASPVTDLGAQPERGQGVDSAQTAQARDRLAPDAVRGELLELAADAVAPREQDVVGVQIVGVRDPRRLVVEVLLGEPVAVLDRPAPARPGEVALAA